MADSSVLPCELHSWSRVKSSLLDLYNRLIGHTVGLEEACRSLHNIRAFIDRLPPWNKDERLGAHLSGHSGQGQGVVWHHLMRFVERMGEDDLNHFLNYTLPGVIQLALAIEEVGEDEKMAWCLHQSGTQVLLSRQFMSSLLACHFLHLCPGQNSFSSLISQASIRPSVGLQLQTVLDYFDWVIKCGLEVKGQLILHRKVLHLPSNLDYLCDCDISFCPLTLVSEDQIKNWEDEMVEVHFRRSSLLKREQERQFEDSFIGLYPELLAVEGRMEGMALGEALVVSGLDTFSSFKPFEDDESADGQDNEDSRNRTQDILVLGGSGSCWNTSYVSSKSPSTALQQALALALLGFSGLCPLPPSLGDSKLSGVDSVPSSRMAMCSAESEMGDELSFHQSAKHSSHQEIFSIDDIVGDDGKQEQEPGEATCLGSDIERISDPTRQHQWQQHQSLYQFEIDLKEAIPSYHHHHHRKQKQNQLYYSSQFSMNPATSPLPLSSSSLSSSSPQPPSTSSLTSSNIPHTSSDSSAYASSSLLPSISTFSVSCPSIVDNLPGASTDEKQHCNLNPFQCSPSSHITIPRLSSLSSTSVPLDISQPDSYSKCCESQSKENTTTQKSNLVADSESHNPPCHKTNEDELNERDGQGGGTISQKTSHTTSSPSSLCALQPSPFSSDPLPRRNYTDDSSYSRFLLADILGNLTKANSQHGAISRITNTSTTTTTIAISSSASSLSSTFNTASRFSHSTWGVIGDDDDDHAVPILFPKSPSTLSPLRSSSPICDKNTSNSNTSTAQASSGTVQERLNKGIVQPDIHHHYSSSPIPISSVILHPQSSSSSPLKATPPLPSSSTPAVPVPTTAVAICSQSTSATAFMPLPPLQVESPSSITTTTSIAASSSTSSPLSPRQSSNIAKSNENSNSPSDKNLISSPQVATNSTTTNAIGQPSPNQCHPHQQSTSTIHLEPPLLLSSSPQSSASSLNNSPNSSFTLPDPALIRNTNFTRNAGVQVTADFYIPGIDAGDNQSQNSSSSTTDVTSSAITMNTPAHQDYTYSVLVPGTNGSRNDYLHSQLQELISSSSSSSGSADRGVGSILLGQIGFPPPLSSSGWGSRSGSISSHGTNGSGSSNDFMELWYNLRRRSSQMSDASRTSSSSKHSSDFSTDLEDISETFSKHAHEVIKEEEGSGFTTLLSDLTSPVMDTELNVGVVMESDVKGQDEKSVVDIPGTLATIGTVDVMMDDKDGYIMSTSLGKRLDVEEQKGSEVLSKYPDESIQDTRGINDLSQLEGIGGNKDISRESSEVGTVRDLTGQLYVNVSVDSAMFSSPADSAFHSEIPSPSLSATTTADPRTGASSTASSSRLESGLGASISPSSNVRQLMESAPSPNATFSPPQLELTVELCDSSTKSSSSFAVLESKTVYLEEKEIEAQHKEQQQQPTNTQQDQRSTSLVAIKKLKPADTVSGKDKLAKQQQQDKSVVASKSSLVSSIPSRATSTSVSRTSSKFTSLSQAASYQPGRQSKPKSQLSPTSKSCTGQIPGRGQQHSRASLPQSSHLPAKTTPSGVSITKSVLKSNVANMHHLTSASSSPASRTSQKLHTESSARRSHETKVSKGTKVTHKSTGMPVISPEASSMTHTTSKKMLPSPSSTSSRIPKSKSSPSPSSVSSLHSSSIATTTKTLPHHHLSSSSSPSIPSSSFKHGRKNDSTKSSPSHSPRSRYLFSDVAAPLKPSVNSANTSSVGKTKTKHKHAIPASTSKGHTLTKKGRERKPRSGGKERKSPEHKTSATKVDHCIVEIQKLPEFWQFVNSLVNKVTSQALAEGAEISSSTPPTLASFDPNVDEDHVDNGAESDGLYSVEGEELSDEVYNWFADKIVHQVFFTVLESLESKDDGHDDDDVEEEDGTDCKINILGGVERRVDSISSYSDEITGLVSQIGQDQHGGLASASSSLASSLLTFRRDKRQTSTLTHASDERPIAPPSDKLENAVSKTMTTLRSHSLNKTVSFEDSGNEYVMRTGSEGDLSSRQSPSRHHQHHHHHLRHHPHHQRTSSGSYYFSNPSSSSSTFNHHQRLHHHHHQQQHPHLRHHQHHQDRLSASVWSVSSGGSNGSQDHLNLGGSSSDLEAMHYSSGDQRFRPSSSSSSLLHIQKRLTKSATDLARWSSLTSMECSWGGVSGGGGGSRGSSPNGSHHNLSLSGRSGSALRSMVLGRNSNSLLASSTRRSSLTNTDSTSHGSLMEYGRTYGGVDATGSDSFRSGRRGSLTGPILGDNSNNSLLFRSSNNEGQGDDGGNDATDDPRLYEAAVSIVNQVFNSISDTLDLEILRATDTQHQPDALYPGASYRSGQYHNIFSSSCQTASSSPSSMRRGRHHHHHHHHRSVSPSVSVFSRKPMSRESLTNAFLKVDSQPSVQNYERRSSEPCHTSVQLSLEVFNKNRYNYKPAEEPQQTACTDDDIGRTTSSRISWRRGSLDNNFSFENPHGHGTMSGFKDPILSRFAEELMKADTSVPELVIVGSNPSSCTTGSRRSSFSGFRDTTLANLESELLNTSFTSMNSLPLSQSPRSISGRSSQGIAKGNNNNSNSKSRESWDREYQQHLQSDSSDTEHWFPPPRRVGDEFHLEFVRQHSQGGQDEIQDLASLFAGCVVQEAVCVIKSDPDFLTDDEMAIGLYAENLTDQILRDAFLSTKDKGRQGSCRNNDDEAINDNGDLTAESKQEKIEEKDRGGRKNTSSPSYHGEGARPKVRNLSSSSTRTHTGGRLSSPSSSTLKISSSSTSRNKSLIGQHSHRSSSSQNASSLPDSRQRSVGGESLSLNENPEPRSRVTVSSNAIYTSSSGTARGHYHRRHHQSDFGPSLSSRRSGSSQVTNQTGRAGASSFDTHGSSSASASKDRKLYQSPSSASASLSSSIPKRNSSKSASASLSTLSTLSHQERSGGKNKVKTCRSATLPTSSTTLSYSSGGATGYQRSSTKSDFPPEHGVSPTAQTRRTSGKPRTSEDQPHGHPLVQRHRHDSGASSSSYSCLDSDPSSSSPRTASGLEDRRRKKFIRQDALSPTSQQHRKPGGTKAFMKGNRSHVHSRRPPQTNRSAREEQSRGSTEAFADRLATALTDKIVRDALREVEILPWWRLLPRSPKAIITCIRYDNSDSNDGNDNNSNIGHRPHDPPSPLHQYHVQIDFLAKWIAASMLRVPCLVLSIGTSGRLPAWLEDAERIKQLLSTQSMGFLASAIKRYWQQYGDTTTTTDTTTTSAITTAANSDNVIDSSCHTKPDVEDDTERPYQASHTEADNQSSVSEVHSSDALAPLTSFVSPITSSSLLSSSSPLPPRTQLPPPPPQSSSSPPSSSSLPALPNPSLFQFLLDLLTNNQQEDQRQK